MVGAAALFFAVCECSYLCDLGAGDADVHQLLCARAAYGVFCG